MTENGTHALNRIADALFQLAKEQRAQNKLQAESVEISKRMLSIHELQSRVSAALEQQIMLDRHESSRNAN